MKKLVFILAFFTSLYGTAQKVALKKGQQVSITTTSTQNAEVMGMEVKSANNTAGTFIVKDADKENYTTSYKLNKVTVNMEVMGQQTTYNSEKPEDKDSDMGKAIGEKIDKEVTVLVNKNTGKASLKEKPSPERPEKTADDSPLDGVLNSFTGIAEDASVETAFFLLPAGKKSGDTWVDSSSSEKLKEVKTYTLKSVTDGIATVLVNGIVEGNTTVEMQGTEVDVTFTTKTTGDIIIEINTSLVKKRTNTAQVTGNLNMMGQSVPITASAEMTIDYK